MINQSGMLTEKIEKQKYSTELKLGHTFLNIKCLKFLQIKCFKKEIGNLFDDGIKSLGGGHPADHMWSHRPDNLPGKKLFKRVLCLHRRLSFQDVVFALAHGKQTRF